MRSFPVLGATGAPPIILQADRVRRRIAASDSVTQLVATLAFGDRQRSDLTHLAAVTAARGATSAGDGL